MKKIFLILMILLCMQLCYGSYEKYPFILTSISEDIIQKTNKDFIDLNGSQWETIMTDKITGLLQYATVSGLPEKEDIRDYKLAIKIANEFLEKNKKLLGIEGNIPECINIKDKQGNPQLGYVWIEYGEQIQNNIPVEGTKIMIRVDYPGIVREIRSRWYPKIDIPNKSYKDCTDLLPGRNMKYKGYGGQEMVYIVQEKDIKSINTVIFPLRKEKDKTIEFYLTWKIIINKEEKRNAWTIYIDAFTGEDILTLCNI